MFDRLLPAADSNTRLWIPQGITRA